MGWVGVDLDGTLAVHDVWQGLTHVGDPVPAMVSRVRRWLADGWDVRIFTARANPAHQTPDEYRQTLQAIRDWCIQHIGRELPITHEKDMSLVEFYDDRAVRIEKNTGRIVS